MIPGILINFSITLKDIVLNALNIIIGKFIFAMMPGDCWQKVSLTFREPNVLVFQTLEVDIIGAYVYIYIHHYNILPADKLTQSTEMSDRWSVSTRIHATRRIDNLQMVW